MFAGKNEITLCESAMKEIVEDYLRRITIVGHLKVLSVTPSVSGSRFIIGVTRDEKEKEAQAKISSA